MEDALAGDARTTAARALALNGATAMGLDRGDVATARLRAEEALEINRQIGDPSGIANSVFMLGVVAADADDFEQGRALFEESLPAFRDLADDHYTLLSTRMLAWMHYELGDHVRATALHQQVVRDARAMGNERMEASSLAALAEYAIFAGRFEDALPMLGQVLPINVRVGETFETSVNLSRFAGALARLGKPDPAARLLSRAEALREESGAAPAQWLAALNEGTLSELRRRLDDAAFSEAWAQGSKLTVEEAVALALREAE